MGIKYKIKKNWHKHTKGEGADFSPGVIAKT